MKILSLLCILLAGCTGTTLYDSSGKKIAHFGSDVSGLAYNHTAAGDTSLSASELSNSKPILALGKALSPAVMAVGSAVMFNGATKVVDAVRKPVVP